MAKRKKITLEDEELTLLTLSNEARALFGYLKRGAYYPVNRRISLKQKKAMKELVDTGLVQLSSRVTQMQLCYVPRAGYTPLKAENWPGLELFPTVV